MNLTGKQLAEQEVITNITEENISQHGVDLNVIKIEKLEQIGRIPKTGRTILPVYSEITPDSDAWHLPVGVYQVTFKQGCKVPSNRMLLIRQRSSLARCGGAINSSVFDAGFKTDNIGTIMTINYPVMIEVGARICQIYSHVWNDVENLYDGQFQADKQRQSYIK